jgi:hypothetical protein
MGTGVVVGGWRAVLSHGSVGVEDGEAVRCCGLLDCNFSGGGGLGGGRSPPFQTSGVGQVCRMRGSLLWAAFMQLMKTLCMLGSPLSVAPLGCGEGLPGVLRRVAEMGLMREVIFVSVWLVDGGGICAISRCQVSRAYGGGEGEGRCMRVVRFY